MNAFFKLQYELNEQFINNIDCSSFEALCHDHIKYFKDHIQNAFDYQDFTNRTLRAKNPLQSFDDLNSYMALYGLGHYQRMRALLEHVQTQSKFQLSQPVKATIVDYGCGQGIATLAFIAHLLETAHQIEELNVILIEPSTLALQRAIHWIDRKAKQTDLKINFITHACHFDELDENYLHTEKEFPIIHLFSNVLDMYSCGRFSLYTLCQKIKNNPAQHSIFAISPDFSSGNIGFDTLHQHLAPQKIYLNETGTVELEEFEYKTLKMRKRKAPVRAYAVTVR